MRISDWSSDVCSSDLGAEAVLDGLAKLPPRRGQDIVLEHLGYCTEAQIRRIARMGLMVSAQPNYISVPGESYVRRGIGTYREALMNGLGSLERTGVPLRSEERSVGTERGRECRARGAQSN